MVDPRFIVKVCGVTSSDDCAVSIEAGANAIGFNFYSKSPRYITPEAARAISTTGKCLRVGVFVNATIEELGQIGTKARLDVLQLHGSVDKIPPGFRTWRGIPAGFLQPDEDNRIEAYLVDTRSAEYGGSGRAFDWNLAKDFPFPMIVAGGLTAENVSAAISKLHPWGVDSCSRLESVPGKKDHAKVRAFVTTAIGAFSKP